MNKRHFSFRLKEEKVLVEDIIALLGGIELAHQHDVEMNSRGFLQEVKQILESNLENEMIDMRWAAYKEGDKKLQALAEELEGYDL
jgi:hypothetical protein